MPERQVPNELDNTFGPEVRFIKAARVLTGRTSRHPPGFSSSVMSGSTGASGQMTVTLRDRADVALWSTTLDPKQG